MEAMCHTPREKKSKSLDKRYSVERERERKKRKERKGKKGKNGKRRSHFPGFWVLSIGREQKREK